MSNTPPRFRFAPSPNGELHLGHAYSALKTWELAERLGGEVLLRIEDIDAGRTRERFVEQIYEDLAWLGLTWPEPVRRQSEHFDDYREAVEQLTIAGLLYPCTATRKQIATAVAGHDDWPTDPDGAPLYPRQALLDKQGSLEEALASGKVGTGIALRLDMERALACCATAHETHPHQTVTCFDDGGQTRTQLQDAAAWGDAIIVRKDTPTSYHLSVVVDDALQGVSHVTRGKDLELATALHVLLQRVLNLPSPAYHHHTLITDIAGRKLSKSLRDTSLRHLRETGWTPEDVRRAVRIDE